MQARRKNIIICSMIILLFVVGYAYNSFTSGRLTDVELGMSEQTMETDETAAVENADGTASETAGAEEDLEATVIEDNSGALEAAGSSFFSEYRLERDKNRSKEVEMWQDIINSDKAEDNFKNLAQQEIVKIVALTEKEMIIENLIIARGFRDALVFLTDDSATVIVDAKELTPANIAQIQDIVVRKTNLNPKNISIIKKN